MLRLLEATAWRWGLQFGNSAPPCRSHSCPPPLPLYSLVKMINGRLEGAQTVGVVAGAAAPARAPVRRPPTWVATAAVNRGVNHDADGRGGVFNAALSRRHVGGEDG